MSQRIKATDYQCCKCNEQAEAFWPCFDPDIESFPYCQECLDRDRAELLVRMFEYGVLND